MTLERAEGEALDSLARLQALLSWSGFYVRYAITTLNHDCF